MNVNECNTMPDIDCIDSQYECDSGIRYMINVDDILN